MAGKTGIAALGALLAVFLQVVLAPNIAIMGTMPSFIIAYGVAIALLIDEVPAYIVVFILGILGDLAGYGPVGALSFILLLSTFAIQFAQRSFGNGTVFVSCIIVLVFVLVVHFLHAAFMVAVTSTYTAIDAFMLIAIPQGLYDCVLAVLLYLALRRVFGTTSPTMASIGPKLH